METKNVVYQGVGIGNVLALVISFFINKSILWAFLHGIFGWFYVIYYALGYAGVIQ